MLLRLAILDLGGGTNFNFFNFLQDLCFGFLHQLIIYVLVEGLLLLKVVDVCLHFTDKLFDTSEVVIL